MHAWHACRVDNNRGAGTGMCPMPVMARGGRLLSRRSVAGRAAWSATDGGPTAPGPPRRPAPPIAHARRLSVMGHHSFSNLSSGTGECAPARERWAPPACAPGCRPLVRRAAPSAPRGSPDGCRRTIEAARASAGSRRCHGRRVACAAEQGEPARRPGSGLDAGRAVQAGEVIGCDQKVGGLTEVWEYLGRRLRGKRVASEAEMAAAGVLGS